MGWLLTFAVALLLTITLDAVGVRNFVLRTLLVALILFPLTLTGALPTL